MGAKAFFPPTAVGVEVVFLAARAQPAERGLAVLNLRGENRLLAEAILDARDDVALEHHAGDGTGKLVAAPPAAAVDVDDERERLVRRLLGEVEVELLRGVAVGDVGEVALQPDAGGQGEGLRGRLRGQRERRGGEEGKEEKGFHRAAA
jgi:hypothetical protein